jgi:GNAT superfamily N-acetyltransferase
MIRPARSDDAIAIASLAAQLGYSDEAPAILTRLRAALDRPEEHVVLVAESTSGQVTGWIHACTRLTIESPLVVEIAGLVVDHGARRLGIGAALVTAVERWAADRGVPVLVVRSNVAREQSHPFYEHLGYVRAKTQHVYRKRLG